jgi:hypothetical protein
MSDTPLLAVRDVVGLGRLGHLTQPRDELVRVRVDGELLVGDDLCPHGDVHAVHLQLGGTVEQRPASRPDPWYPVSTTDRVATVPHLRQRLEHQLGAVDSKRRDQHQPPRSTVRRIASASPAWAARVGARGSGRRRWTP